MQPTICVCCYEPMPAGEGARDGNPNVCPMCASALADLSNSEIATASPDELDRGAAVPFSASHYGGTFVWQKPEQVDLEQGS